MGFYVRRHPAPLSALPLPSSPRLPRRRHPLLLVAVAALTFGSFAAGRQAGLAARPPGRAANVLALAARGLSGTGPDALSWVHPPVPGAAADTGAAGPTGASATPTPAAPSVLTAAGTATEAPTAAMVPDPATSLVAVESFTAASDRPGGNVHLGTGFVVATDGTGAWVATAAHVAVPALMATGGTHAGSTGASVPGSGAGSTGDAASRPALAVYLPGQPAPHVADRVEIDPHADLALLHVPFLPEAAPVTLGRVPHSAWAGEVSCVRWPDWTFQAYPIPLQPGAFPTAGADYGILPTPQLSVLPGCSGGPLNVYGAAGDGAAVVVGAVVSGTVDPPGVGFVPAAAIEDLLASRTSAPPAG